MESLEQHPFWNLWRGEQPAVASLFVLMLLQFTGVAMVGPAAAFFAMNDIGLDAGEVGYLMSAQAGVQVVAAWGCGRLSDALGRRLCILGCFACGTLGLTLLGFAQTKTELWVAALIQGGQAGFYPISDSYILDSVKKEERPAYTGMYGAAFGMTFVLGNAIGATLLGLGIERRVLFFMGAGMSACAVTYGVMKLHESFSSTLRRQITGGDPSESDWRVVGGGLLSAWACNFCFGLCDGFMTMYPFIVQDLYGWRDSHMAAGMGSVGLCAGLVMMFVFPELAKRFGSPCMLGIGCMCGAIGYAFFPQGQPVHILGLVFWMLAIALFNPAYPVVIGIFAGERHFGFASGVGGASRSLAAAVSPMFAGRLYEIHGAWNMLFGSACFLGGSFAALGVYLSPVPDLDESKPLV